MTFIVGITRITYYRVEADDEEDAIDAALCEGGEETGQETIGTECFDDDEED